MYKRQLQHIPYTGAIPLGSAFGTASLGIELNCNTVCTLPRYTVAVSYTHLDVYKRQVVLQDSDIFLPREDAEIAAAVLENLEARGIQVLRGIQVQRIRDREDGADLTVRTEYGERKLSCNAVLVATGRRSEEHTSDSSHSRASRMPSSA